MNKLEGNYTEFLKHWATKERTYSYEDVAIRLASEKKLDYWQRNSIYGIESDSDILFSRWSTGGVSGGSYLDDSEPTAYHSEDTEPHNTILDEILEHYVPNISYLTFRKLNALFSQDSYENNEYYGNRTDYAVRYIKMTDLYEFLKGLQS